MSPRLPFLTRRECEADGCGRAGSYRLYSAGNVLQGEFCKYHGTVERDRLVAETQAAVRNFGVDQGYEGSF